MGDDDGSDGNHDGGDHVISSSDLFLFFLTPFFCGPITEAIVILVLNRFLSSVVLHSLITHPNDGTSPFLTRAMTYIKNQIKGFRALRTRKTTIASAAIRHVSIW